MLESFLHVVLTALFLVPFSSLGKNTFVVLDRSRDLTSDWSSTNCTYAEIYPDLNRLQCRVTTHPSRHVVEELREFPRKRGFWNPCTQRRCEIGYELKPRSGGETRIRVNVQGFLSGKGGIEVNLVTNDTTTVEVGKLKVVDHWSQESFFVSITTNSILKILITQPSPPDDLALLDRITIESNPHQPVSSFSVNKYSLLQPKIRASTTDIPKVLTTFGSSRSTWMLSTTTKTPITMTEMSKTMQNLTVISRKDGKEKTILMKDEVRGSGTTETGPTEPVSIASSQLSTEVGKDETIGPSTEPEVVPTQSLTANKKGGEGVLPTSVPQSSPPTPSDEPEPEGEPTTASDTTSPKETKPVSTFKESSGVTESNTEDRTTMSLTEYETESTVPVAEQQKTSESSSPEPERTPVSDPALGDVSTPEPEGTPSVPEPEAEKTSTSAAAVPEIETTVTSETESIKAAASASIPHSEVTVPVVEPEATPSSSIPEPTSSSIPEPEASSSAPIPEPEGTTSIPEPEATESASIPEPETTSAAVPEPEATATMPETEGTPTIPEPEATASIPEPEATATIPEPEATASIPEPEATASIPEPEATASVPEPEATASIPEPEATASIPQSETTPEPEPEKTATSEGIPETGSTAASEPNTATASVPEPEATPSPASENSGSTRTSLQPTVTPQPEPAGTIPTKVENNTMAESYSSGRNMAESSAPWGLYIGIPAGAIIFIAILGVGYFMKKKRGRGSVTP